MRDYYRVLQKLGSGSYGEVRNCMYMENILDIRSSMKSYRAVKCLSKSHMEDKDVKSFQNEVGCLYRLNNPGHPNILKLYHYFEDTKRYMLVTEVVGGGEVFDKVQKKEKMKS